MERTLDDGEREILIRLISDALEDRASAIKELVNRSRPKLYVIFAKLSDGRVGADATETGTADENDATGAGASWPAERPRAVS